MIFGWPQGPRGPGPRGAQGGPWEPKARGAFGAPGKGAFGAPGGTQGGLRGPWGGRLRRPRGEWAIGPFGVYFGVYSEAISNGKPISSGKSFRLEGHSEWKVISNDPFKPTSPRVAASRGKLTPFKLTFPRIWPFGKHLCENVHFKDSRSTKLNVW